MSIETDLIAVRDALQAHEVKLNDFVNGGENTTITTPNGTYPSLDKLTKGMDFQGTYTQGTAYKLGGSLMLGHKFAFIKKDFTASNTGTAEADYSADETAGNIETAVDLDATVSAAETSETNASTSENNAGTSETNAGNSATAAGTSETNAGTSETNAGNSATAAGTSASNAYTSETNAGNSASQANTTLTTVQSIANNLDYQGNYDASPNTAPSSPTVGQFWSISVGGTFGGATFAVSDLALYDGTNWHKQDIDTILQSVTVTAADITDATATGQAAITAADAAALRDASGLAGAYFYRPENYGVIDGVSDDVQIQAALAAAGGGTVMLDSAKTYVMRDRVDVGACTLDLNGATVQRADASTATLTAVVADQATTLTVDAVPSHWGLETHITIVSQSGHHDQNATTGGSSPVKIQSISGNTITVQAAIDLPVDGSLDGAGEWPVGATVVQTYDLFRLGTSGAKIINGTIDGNRANNPQIKDWLFNRVVQSSASHITIEGVRFENQPGGCSMLNSPFTITNCEFENNNAGAVHISSTVTEAIDDNAGWAVMNNWGRNICEESDGASHDEAFVTSSNGVQHGVISNNIVWAGPNTEGMVFGRVSGASENHGLLVQGNYFHGFREITTGWNLPATGTHQKEMYSFIIESNQFDDCGDIIMRTSPSNGVKVRGLAIRGNQFFGSRINVESPASMEITDNWFFPHDTKGNSITFAEPESAWMVGYIHFRGERITIRGNHMYGPEVEQTYLQRGIAFLGDSHVSGYRYSNTILIENNLIDGLIYGIMPFSAGNPSGSEHGILTVQGNTVINHMTNTSAKGIICGPTWLVQNNLVIYWSANFGGIHIFSWDNGDTVRQGPIVRDNTIRTDAANDPGKALIVGRGNNLDSANITVVNNTFGGSSNATPNFTVYTGDSQVIQGNIALPIQSETDLDAVFIPYDEKM